MKVCLVFRGDTYRGPHADVNRKYIDILMCWDNLKKTLLDDLTNNGHEYEIAFITYPNEFIKKIIEVINPKHIKLYNKEVQSKNFGDVITFMQETKHDYDRFVILRCDFRYKIRITHWPKWEKKGIFIVNKDVTWPSSKLYADVMFMVDSYEIDTFERAHYLSVFNETIHGLGRYLYVNNIPFHLMYEDYYHMNNHPMQSLASLEDDPDIDNPIYIEPIRDVSQWN